MAKTSATDRPSPDAPLAVAAAAIVESRAERMLSLRPALLNPNDVEAVHDMRVASRRLRSVLEMFEPCFDAKAHRRALRNVRALTHALGPRRDLDVQLQILEPLAAVASVVDRFGIDALIASRVELRTAAQEQMPQAIGLLEDPRFTSDLATLTRPPRALRPVTPERLKQVDPAAPLKMNAFVLIDKRAKRLQKIAAEAVETAATADLHEARIAAKRLRYAIHAVGFCFKDDLTDLHDHVRTIQNILGDLHDCDVLSDAIDATTASFRAADAQTLAAIAPAGPDRLAWIHLRKAPNRREYAGLAKLSVLTAARREACRLQFSEYWKPLADGQLRAMLRSAD